MNGNFAHGVIVGIVMFIGIMRRMLGPALLVPSMCGMYMVEEIIVWEAMLKTNHHDKEKTHTFIQQSVFAHFICVPTTW